MADTRLTKIGLFQAIYLCFLGAFSPLKLTQAEITDEENRKNLPQPPPPPEPRAFRVRRALWSSLFHVLSSIGIGYLCGVLLRTAISSPCALLIRILQIFGATILLWATLFVRGWDIQSWGGVTLTERVNRWLIRFLYCLGTAVIAASLVL